MPQSAVSLLSVRLPRERWAWVAIVLGFSLLYPSSESLYFGIVSSSWPKADATITYSTAKETRRRDYVDIRYTYVVDGGVYTGDRWRYMCFMNSWQMRTIEVDAAQAAYPLGSHPRVAVDPRNPQRSVLEPGPHFDDLLWIGGGLMFAATGLLSGGTRRASRARDSGSPASDIAVASIARPVWRRYPVAFVLACISFLLMSVGLHQIYGGIRSASWPIVQGRVLFSRTNGPNGSGNYRTEIRYEYFLAGERYGGAASLLAGHDDSFALSRSHRLGAAVTVHYDPGAPDRSVIVTGITWHHFMLPLFALAVLPFALLAKALTDARAAGRNVVR